MVKVTMRENGDVDLQFANMLHTISFEDAYRLHDDLKELILKVI